MEFSTLGANLQLRKCGELEHFYATAVPVLLRNRSCLLLIRCELHLGGSIQRPGRKRKMCVTATADVDGVGTAEETVPCTPTIANEANRTHTHLICMFCFEILVRVDILR